MNDDLFGIMFLDVPGLQSFGFHGKVNKEIRQNEPGDLLQENILPINGRLSYFNEDLVLKPGDTINFWLSIQHDKLGYRRDNQKWVVTGALRLVLN